MYNILKRVYINNNNMVFRNKIKYKKNNLQKKSRINKQ